MPSSQPENHGLSPKEFEQLVARLSKRKKETQSRISLDVVKESLEESGLLEVMDDNDIEFFKNQADKVIRKHQRRNQLILAMTSAFLFAPIFIYSGYTINNYFNIEFNFDNRTLSIERDRPEHDLALVGENSELKSNNESLEETVQKLNDENQKLENERQEQNETFEAQRQELEEQIRNLEKQPSQPAPVEPASPSPSESQLFGNTQELAASFQGCTRDGESVTCEVALKNIKRDADLIVYHRYRNRNLRAIEINGDEYIPDVIFVGNKKNEINYIEQSVSQKLIKNINLKTTLYFENIPLDVTEFQVIEISVDLKSEGDKGQKNEESIPVQLRENLQISQE